MLRILSLLVMCTLVACKFEQANSGHPLALSRDRCTAIAVGRMATKDGATMTTHTMDCKECDWRINKVPAADHLPGSRRPIYLLSGAYPRQVRNDRGLTWSVDNLEDLSPQKEEWMTMKDKVIMGSIPQVEHTFALVEGGYGIMNEHQVAIGESTCASRLYAKPIGQGGKALLEASELSQIALERTKTAREAILLMGALAEEYGFYSGDWSNNAQQEMGEGGEALTVVDKNEVWMFHIMPDDTGEGAIWVAQRVPDNHIVAAANTFVIREIPDQGELHDDFMMSTNLHDIGARMGWYDPSQGKKLHFLKTFAPERYHPSYSHLRVWRIFTFANPSLNLPIDTDSYADDYPFSVEVSSLHFLSPEDLMTLQSDHFEGTKYDPTKGLASGPYGDPNRYDASATLPDLPLDEVMAGEYPRAISLFRTTYSFVTVSRNFAPDILSMFWFAPYAPSQSSYTPIFVKSDTLPKPYTSGTMHRYDPTVAWWNHCVVGNWANRFYKYSMQMVNNVKSKLYLELEASVKLLEIQILTEYAANTNGRVIPDVDKNAFEKKWIDALTELTLSSGEFVTSTWRDLFPVLMATYRDGYIVKDLDKATANPTAFFYPKFWLKATGYFDNPGNKDLTDDAIMFSTNPVSSSDTVQSSDGSIEITTLLFAFAFMVIIFSSGYLYGKRCTPYQPVANSESVEVKGTFTTTTNDNNNNNNNNNNNDNNDNHDNNTENGYDYKSFFLSLLGGQASNQDSGRHGYESIEMAPQSPFESSGKS